MKLNTNIKICRKWTGKRINKHKNTRKEKIKKKNRKHNWKTKCIVSRP